MPRKKISKSQVVRDYAGAHPTASVNEIAAKLKVSYSLAYKALHGAKAQPQISRERGGKRKPKPHAPRADKFLSAKAWSIEKAKELMKGLKTLAATLQREARGN